MKATNKTRGEIVRAFLNKSGFSCYRLAVLAGVPHPTMWRIIHDKTVGLKYETAEKISKATGGQINILDLLRTNVTP